jgi:predicted PurR-regulated permease PerM
MEKKDRIEQIGEVVAIALLVIGCYWVIRPFLGAVAWAAILCYVTWPVYSRINRGLSKKPQLAAILMTLLIALGIVIPVTVIILSLTDDLKVVLTKLPELFREGLPDPPRWLAGLPLIGGFADSYWADIAHSGEGFREALKKFLSVSQDWFVRRGVNLGHGILQLCLSVFITFFFYRDGEKVVQKVFDAVKRIVGDRTQHILGIIGKTMKGVVYGILGTAIVQGVLGGLGFWVANLFLLAAAKIPLPLLLGLLTFFFSLIPFGPPLVWLPVCGWLAYQKEYGMFVIMIIWGAGVISTVDNLIKPYLISRESKLPFIMVFLGVLGGVIAFGFIGVFVGPAVLSVGYTLVQEWGSGPRKAKNHA